MCKFLLIALTLLMVLATEGRYSFIETVGVYGLIVKDKKDKSYPV